MTLTALEGKEPLRQLNPRQVCSLPRG